jgi:hypothetical protein
MAPILPGHVATETSGPGGTISDMPQSADPIVAPDIQRRLAVALFNRSWELLEQADRSPADDRELLASAMASRLHWQGIGTEENYAAGDWLVAHVASRLGHAGLALDFATAAYETVAAADPPLEFWLLASAMEGLARAHDTAGHDAERDSWAAASREVLAVVIDDEDRELIAAQLSSIPGLAGS